MRPCRRSRGDTGREESRCGQLLNLLGIHDRPNVGEPIVLPLRHAAVGPSFQDIVKRHMMMKMKYPDAKVARGMPYGGIANLRPESQALVQAFMAWQPKRPPNELLH